MQLKIEEDKLDVNLLYNRCPEIRKGRAELSKCQHYQIIVLVQ
jgi:hypothetical protein